jgi:hypothetical protein
MIISSNTETEKDMNAAEKSDLIRSVAIPSSYMALVRAAQQMPDEGVFTEVFSEGPFSVHISGLWSLDTEGQLALEFQEIVIGDEAEIEILSSYERHYTQSIVDRIESRK